MQFTFQKYRSLLIATRAKDWRFSFIPQIFGNLYLWLILFDIPFSISSILLLILSFLTSFGFAALGYFINEFFDKEDDENSNKVNKLKLVSSVNQFCLFVLILLFTFLPWLYLPFNNISIVLISTQITLFILYCVPPIRFKKNAYLAVILDALYAYTIPLLLSYYTYFLFVSSNTIYFSFLIAYSFLLFIAGFRNIIIHYINDIFKDKLSGTITLPRIIGVRKTNALLKFLLYSELFLCTYVILLVALKQKILYLLFFVVFYLIYKAIKQSRNLKDNIIVNRSIRHIPDLYYQVYAPAIILFTLVFYNVNWLILLPIHIALFVPLFRFHPIVSWFQRINFKLFYIWLRQLLSWIVNYTIFFFFLLIGVNLKIRKISALGYLKIKLHIK
ncbi:MAG: UbiA family prenyltransferase [Bacteroidia bacterium]|nr:UbiA family prenyltransferase [Bacteroidia bacterium]